MQATCIHINLHPWPRAGFSQVDSQSGPAFQGASTSVPNQKTRSFLKTLLRGKTILISQGSRTINQINFSLPLSLLHTHTHTHTLTHTHTKYCNILTSNSLYHFNWDNLFLLIKAPVTLSKIKIKWTNLPLTEPGVSRNGKQRVQDHHDRVDLYTDGKEQAAESRAAKAGRETGVFWKRSTVSFSVPCTHLPCKVAKKKKKGRCEMGERKLNKKSTFPSPISSHPSPKEPCLSVQT